MQQPQLQTAFPDVSSARRLQIKAGVRPLFPTWIYHCQENGSLALNERLEQLTRQLLQDDRNATRRTNCGGWHYAFDFFELKEPVVADFRDQMEQHVWAFLDHFRHEGAKKKDRFRLRGWINVN